MTALLSAISHYSFGRSAASPEEIVARAEQEGYSQLAISEYDTMASSAETYGFCQRKNLKWSAGCRISLPLSTSDIMSQTNEIVCFPSSLEGYKELSHQLSIPVEERKIASLISAGAIFLVPPHIEEGRLDAFGENLWGIVADHETCFSAYEKCVYTRPSSLVKYSEETKEDHANRYRRLLELSEKTGLPLVAFPAVRYRTASDTSQYRVMRAIWDGTKLPEDESDLEPISSAHVLSIAEAETIYTDMFPGSWDNLQRLAHQLPEITPFPEETPVLPVPQFCQGRDTAKILRELCYEGGRKRWGEINNEQAERLEHELGVIIGFGFQSYFLILHALCNWCGKQGIPIGPGRGSACGSAVAYCLFLTDVDPLEHDLLFERFLNPGRVEMPDIDLDFSDDRRDEVINYLADEYGDGNVATVSTYSYYRARNSIKDSARIMSFPTASQQALADLVPKQISGRAPKLMLMLSANPPSGMDGIDRRFWEVAKPMRDKYYEMSEEGNKRSPEGEVLHTARGIEGKIRHKGTHASAIMLSDKPIHMVVPVSPPPLGQKIGSTEYEHGVCEQAGLLKLDILGVAMIRVIDNCARRLGVSASDLDLEDPQALEMLASGDTYGVFQMEKLGAEVCRVIEPQSFADLVAINSLVRPGPVKLQTHYQYAKGKQAGFLQEDQIPHPEMKDLLSETYGLVLYQEQIMRIGAHYAGFSLSQADHLRKVISKKKDDEMEDMRQQFIRGCVSREYSQEIAEKIWRYVEPFGSYGFNKSHSVGYSIITSQSAYLSRHHPAMFFAELAIAKPKEDVAAKFGYAKVRNVSILGPTVTDPKTHHTASKCGRFIKCGLSAMQNIGEITADQIVEEKEKNGDYLSVQDFADRLNTIAKGRTGIYLTAIGFFDALESNRQKVANILLGKSSSTPAKAITLAGMVKEETSIPKKDESVELPDINKIAPLPLDKHPEGTIIEWYD